MKKLFASLLFLTFSNLVSAGCIEIDGETYCGKGKCVELKGNAYCAASVDGDAVVYKGKAYCGAGTCMEKRGNIYCSQFPGGGMIKHNKSLWTGPGECTVHNGTAFCSNEAKGRCFSTGNQLKCQGGWVRVIPDKAERCERGEKL